MRFKEIISKINKSTYLDYSSNTCLENELELFESEIQKKYGISLDSSYYDFIRECNGFDLGGWVFYGSKNIPSLSVKSVFYINDFWRREFKVFESYFIIAEGDMVFYCYSIQDGKYLVILKGFMSDIFESYSSFNYLLKSMVRNHLR